MSRGREKRTPVSRIAILLAVALGLIISTIGPANTAGAGPLIGRGGPGWLASNDKVNITAPSARIYDLDWVTLASPVRRANGTMSPADTIFLRVRKLEFDDISIKSIRPDHTWEMSNPNGTNRDSQLTIGNDEPGTKIGLWVIANSLKICLTPETLNTLVEGYAGVFGGRLDEVLLLIQEVFQPYVNGPLRRVGPCIPIQDLLPILSVIVDAGVPLPDMLPVIKLNIDAYAAQVKTGKNSPSVRAPVVKVRMYQ